MKTGCLYIFQANVIFLQNIFPIHNYLNVMIRNMEIWRDGDSPSQILFFFHFFLVHTKVASGRGEWCVCVRVCVQRETDEKFRLRIGSCH